MFRRGYRGLKPHLAWLWRPKTRVEKVCMAILWGAVLFSILVNVAVSSARAEEPVEPPSYVVEELESECVDVDAADEQYRELVLLAGLCEVQLERLDAIGQLLEHYQAELAAASKRVTKKLEEGVSVMGVEDEPLSVSEVDPVSLEMTEEAVTAAGLAQREAIWAFAGLAIGLFAGYAIYRQVMPRG